ncbi:class I SAM-dependent DNA methyltransferase [Streptomyces sp. NRRL S-340]|uniref:class I SAM-dependent DNA methyltransferase n=1 Tax=Streptomyces sp. NRRL S-340 TaxID=1463901 RepID=UPI00055E9BE3|nr:class I SAM-dependent methyltransferase [Streptomyces sp. NRRL S-340]
MNSPAGRSGQGTGPRDRTGQAEAFDSIGERYDAAFPHKDGQIEATDWLVASLPAGARVLDLGCGTGVPTARRLAQAGLDVVGVDLSARMVALARAQVPGARFHQGDLADVRPHGPLDLGRFEAVAAFFSLLMLPRAEIPGVLSSVRELLVPQGLFALSMVEADADDLPVAFLGSTIRVSGHPRGELRAVVERAGFEVVEESSRSYAPSAPDPADGPGAPPEVQLFLRCRRLG